ncbi:NAD(P)H-dependent oxidoreductase [Yersinia aldovae]|uniref:FMN dependent NADH:quinone oxidoreductase n=1 Tax=Yersinia aldovae TaxID=29483 RepID=A0A0T9TWG4_YERAL|nr:NAD(P)H-dependent oxidoreductase [Yersinia aldovae]EEP95740.1 NAD(P)H dehydrogenase (Quinone) [Yersinia aldovae ATCC 35236]CNJ12391.1 azoreductase [Yersinia aldovae]CNL06061.1 azoreductase [Yersinia aldovae]CNL39317.1 azoreductase [Yersinia aldovae]
MSNILVLKSSIMGDNSQTNMLIDTFLVSRQDNGFVDTITEHDLTTMDLPVLNSEIFTALRAGNNLNEHLRSVVALSDSLIVELKESDMVVIGAPMYNLNVPTQLKNWFDLIARADITFKYTESYPIGLIEGVSAVIISSSGGIHVNQKTDAVTPYLQAVLGLIGITDVEFVYAEGMDMRPYGRAKGLADARIRIASLVG